MTYTDHHNVAFEPGAAAVARVLERSGLKPTAAQAKEIWLEAMAVFDASESDWSEEIQEMLDAPDGYLDTMPRDDLRGAIARALTGMPWPTNGEGSEVGEKFLTAFSKVMIEMQVRTDHEVIDGDFRS